MKKSVIFGAIAILIILIVGGVLQFVIPKWNAVKWMDLYLKSVTLYEKGDYAEAIPVAKETLKIAKEDFSNDHSKIIDSLNNLPMLYEAQKNYSEAEALYRRSMEILEKTDGSNDLYVAASMSNLAKLYLMQDDYSKAEPLLKRSLEIRKKMPNPDSFEIARTLDDLAYVYRMTNRAKEALKINKQIQNMKSKNK